MTNLLLYEDMSRKELMVEIQSMECTIRSLRTDAHFNSLLDYDRGYQAGKQFMLKQVLEAKNG